ncbi:hypothetical protein PENARI_c001G08809 [Penicillium arizonense]|uniref:HD domain-containing protein n=1 Tax=Penicillium arizonense TaxID=1835702 RepID=A0A1F5LXY2_PENAI|nr:hypothetical protein PENARI_c001G08809 [Penicillium arizonense]OGE58013.1 hypothetical protein PENARI_c001G08809 [Penicillium arizonense]
MPAQRSEQPLPSVEAHTQATIKTLFKFLHEQGQGDYLGEKVTQLEHSLQCAHLAAQSAEYGHDMEVVLAALLHDVGRFIPAAEKMGKMVTPDGHEKVSQLVGAHVMAKRYLVTTDQKYHDGLSETSKRTLKFQGGGFTPEEARKAQEDPLLEAKLAVRRWDDLAKVPKCVVPPLEAYEEMAFQCLLESRSKFKLHSREYILPTKPTVVICIDGFDPEYLQSGIERDNYGRTPIFVARQLNNSALIDLLREARRKQKEQLRANGASESGISIHTNSDTIMRSLTRTDTEISVHIPRPIWALANLDLIDELRRLQKLLIDHGAELNLPNIYGRTPLLLTAIYNEPEVAALLLEAGADMNTGDSRRMSPLSFSSSSNISISPMLVERGADLPADRSKLNNMLHLAASYGNEGAVRRLVAAGAGVWRKNFYGMTPFALAKKYNHEGVANLILELSQSSQARASTDPETTLHQNVWIDVQLTDRANEATQPKLESEKVLTSSTSQSGPRDTPNLVPPFFMIKYIIIAHLVYFAHELVMIDEDGQCSVG